jgi:hypothetical protein
MQPYAEAYPVGTKVVVAPLADLEEFRLNWRWHDPWLELSFNLRAKKPELSQRASMMAEASFTY